MKVKEDLKYLFDEEATRANMKLNEKFYEDKSIDQEGASYYIQNNTPAIKITGNDE